ncbi:hypothetical protein MATL_G00179800 [Megalops atlanticus]|uniref:CD99 antigen-like protein 2 n=1 Tax=Megalops atlanticus TaxID=7932 RepID=A0A9D3PMW8_MEGAT|nr:hypothetical protein MATL_G00179800 [Megalops atlanticus]
MSFLWIFLLATLAIGTKGQEGFDLSDALDDDVPTKAPIPKRPEEPKKPSGGDLDLLDALGPEPAPPAPKDPKAPAGGGLDLSDALGPDPEPKKPAVKPPKSGGTGGGDFGDSDLFGVVDSGNDYKPDKGKGGGRVQDPSYDVNGGGGEGHQDVELPWTQLLKLLSDNIPEGFHMWIKNLKEVVVPLLERVMELLDVTQS